MKEKVKEAPCLRCNRVLPIRCREFCNSCYMYWRRQNNPESAKGIRMRYAQTHHEHNRAYQQQWRDQNREKLREASMKKRLAMTPEERRDLSLRASRGITLEDYNRLLAIQHGRCAICYREQFVRSPNGSRHLHVDHNHRTGDIRGLLCGYCNTALGHVEKERWLVLAMAYLGYIE